MHAMPPHSFDASASPKIAIESSSAITGTTNMLSDAVPDLKAAIAYSETAGDYVSRELFEDILESEEEHIDWLETQISLAERLGLQNWLQLKVGKHDAS